MGSSAIPTEGCSSRAVAARPVVDLEAYKRARWDDLVVAARELEDAVLEQLMAELDTEDPAS